MKNNIKLILLTLFLGCKSFGQVTTSITSVYVNSQTTYASCSLIDFGSVSNNSLTFYFKLTKPSSQALGDSNLKILLKNNSFSYGSERANIIVQSGSWSNGDTEFIGTIACNISESEIQVTGSSVLIEFTTDTGVKTSSCEYPLTKTPPPSFTFSPTSLSLPCGDTSSRTFTVTPANIPSGATVTYQWSYSGWSQISSTSTSKTLQPSSGTSLPSTVSVTPYVNGVAQPTRTCTVTRAAFSSSATVSGSSALCSSAIYSVTGLQAGQSVTNWNLAYSNSATLSPSTGNTTTVTKTGTGQNIVYATITNSCNQTVTKQMTLTLGSPIAPGPIFGPTAVATGALVSYQVSPVAGATSYLWWLPYPYDTVSSFDFSGQNWQKLTNSSSSSSIQVFTGLGKTAGLVQVMAVNQCGAGPARTINVTHGGSGGGIPRLSKPEKHDDVIVYPNPATNVVNIELKNKNYVRVSNAKITATLYDVLGKNIQSIEVTNTKATLNVENLQRGMYVLKINIDDAIESHQICIE